MHQVASVPLVKFKPEQIIVCHWDSTPDDTEVLDNSMEVDDGKTLDKGKDLDNSVEHDNSFGLQNSFQIDNGVIMSLDNMNSETIIIISATVSRLQHFWSVFDIVTATYPVWNHNTKSLCQMCQGINIFLKCANHFYSKLYFFYNKSTWQTR